MNSKLKDDFELLDLMLEDQESQADVYQPSVYWKDYQVRFSGAIRKDGIEGFRGNPGICKAFAPSGISWPEIRYSSGGGRLLGLKGRVKSVVMGLPIFNEIVEDYRNLVRTTDSRKRRFAGAYYQSVLDPIDFPENTNSGGAAELISISGEDYSWDYANYLLRIQNFARKVNFGEVSSAIEIGGGIGVWPHLMNHRYPNISRFVYVDIPPMIYLATQYLKQFFHVTDYRETRDRETIRFREDVGSEVICLCPWQIERVGESIDLFWNTASLSEMSPEIVRNYGKCLERLNLRKICLILNKPGKQAGTCPRDVIQEAFGGGFEELKEVEDIPNYSPYYVKTAD